MTGKTGTDAPEPRRRVWPKLLLVASLTLNVLVLSVIAGAQLRDGRDHRRTPPVDRAMLREGSFMPFFEAMPRAARMRMAEAFRKQAGGLRPDKGALAEDFRDIVQALRADPFVPEALVVVLEAPHARAAARVNAGRILLVEEITGMTPAERGAFADTLEERFRDALARAPGKPRPVLSAGE